MPKEMDPETVTKVMDLTRQGYSQSKIANKLGITKSKVQRIQNKHAKSNQESNHAHATDSVESGVSEPNRNTPFSLLTQENTAKELLIYTQFFRDRTKNLPIRDKLSDHDRMWAEGNYGKRWADGIKMMIDTTGLSAEALMSVIDDCEVDMNEALERFNSKFRKDEGET